MIAYASRGPLDKAYVRQYGVTNFKPLEFTMKTARRLFLLLVLTLCFALEGSAQSARFAKAMKTASRGDIAEIKDQRRVYVDAHLLLADSYAPVRQSVINELKKYSGVEVVDLPEAAEFSLLVMVDPVSLSAANNGIPSYISVMAVAGNPEAPSRILWQHTFPSSTNQLDAVTAARTFVK